MPFNPAWLPKPLLLPYGGKTYVAPAPSKDVGIMLASILSVGSGPVAAALTGRALDSENSGATPAQREIVAQLTREGAELADLTLGTAYAEMITDRVPGPDIDRMALYGLYYWTMGEEAADQIMALAFGESDSLGESQGSAS